MKSNKITAKVNYLGELRCQSEHVRSGENIISDAPVDNNGQGAAFSPTDLVATALAKCVLTIMGIKARDMGVDIAGSSAEVIKTMASGPRRISQVEIEFQMQGRDVDEEQRLQLERSGRACPVAKSLHADLEQELRFVWV